MNGTQNDRREGNGVCNFWGLIAGMIVGSIIVMIMTWFTTKWMYKRYK